MFNPTDRAMILRPAILAALLTIATALPVRADYREAHGNWRLECYMQRQPVRDYRCAALSRPVQGITAYVIYRGGQPFIVLQSIGKVRFDRSIPISIRIGQQEGFFGLGGDFGPNHATLAQHRRAAFFRGNEARAMIGEMRGQRTLFIRYRDLFGASRSLRVALEGFSRTHDALIAAIDEAEAAGAIAPPPSSSARPERKDEGDGLFDFLKGLLPSVQAAPAQ